MKDIDNLIDRIAEKYEKEINEYVDKFEEDFYIVSNETNEIFFDEANKIYNSFIKEYYKYKTKSYIRHWEKKPGTGKGTNLFYGNQNKIHRGLDPYFEIMFDASKMKDDYQHDDAETVLQQVMEGTRGVPPYWTEPWDNAGKPYKTKYFEFTGNLMDAYYHFLDNYNDKMTSVFMRKWKKRRNN